MCGGFRVITGVLTRREYLTFLTHNVITHRYHWQLSMIDLADDLFKVTGEALTYLPCTDTNADNPATLYNLALKTPNSEKSS